MIVILGASASGKSTIESRLVEKYGYKKTVSYTTRALRPGEINGINYYFISEDKFLNMKNNGAFAESATYNGWHYGTAKNDCADDKVTVVTPHGLRQFKKIDTLNINSFFINMPRKERLIKSLKRGDGSDFAINETLRRDPTDIGQYDGIEDEVDFVIRNDGKSKTIDEICEEIIRLVKE